MTRRTRRSAAAVAVGLLIGAGLTACATGSGASATAGDTGPRSAAAPTSVPLSSGASTTGVGPAAAVDLPVTPSVRAELVAAGAASRGLPPTAFVSLVPRETYYGRDNRTGTYWAAAGLVPSAASTPAQVSMQDDGAYVIFNRRPGTLWRATNVGLPAGTTLCPRAGLPSDVAEVWGWQPGTCHPPTGDGAAELAAFIGTWYGHTRTLTVRPGGEGTEEISAGCCSPVVSLSFRLSDASGAPSDVRATLTVTRVRVDDPGAFSTAHPAPRDGQTAVVHLVDGVITEPVTGTTYCGPSPGARGRCGA